MTWFDILKQPTFTAYKIPQKEEQEEGDCNRKLKEYADRLRNRQLLLELSLDPDKFTSAIEHSQYGNTEIKLIRYEMKQDYHQAHYGLTSGSSLATEKIMFLYKPVPEVVACKALELIQQNDGMETMTVDDIQYHIFVFGADSQSVIPESGPVHMEIRAGQSPRLQSPSSGTIHMPSTVVELVMILQIGGIHRMAQEPLENLTPRN